MELPLDRRPDKRGPALVGRAGRAVWLDTTGGGPRAVGGGTVARGGESEGAPYRAGSAAISPEAGRT